MSKINLHNYEAFLLDSIEGNLPAEDVRLLKRFLILHPELGINLDEVNLPYLESEKEEIGIKDKLKRNEEAVQDELALNYLEGLLLPEERMVFEARLKHDQELADDLNVYKQTILLPDTTVVNHSKSALYKSEEHLILNNRCIAYIEKQLSGTEKDAFEKELEANPVLKAEMQLFSKTILQADGWVVFPDKETLKKTNKLFVLYSYQSLAGMAAAVVLLFGLAFIYNYYQPSFSGSTDYAAAETAKELLPPLSEIKTEPPVVRETLANMEHPKRLAEHVKNTNAGSRLTQRVPADALHAIPANTVQYTAQQIDSPLKDSVNTHRAVQVADNHVLNDSEDNAFSKQTYLVLEEGFMEEEDAHIRTNKRKGLWKRAVHIAQQANKLGVKSIDGAEVDDKKFSLSFNSFSVGKK